MPHSGSLPAARVPFTLLLRAQRTSEVGLRLDPDRAPGTSATPATDALAAFRAALQNDPTEADYHYMMGETLLRLGRTEEALPLLREAARLQPQNATYHDVLACALWEQGDFEDSYGAFAEAVRVAANPQASLDGLAATLLQLDRPKEALAVIHRAQRADRGDGRLYSNLGVALWELGKRGEALRAFRRAAELCPDSASVRRNLGQAFIASGELEAARVLFAEVVRRRPQDAQAHADLGDVLYALRRESEAEVSFDEAVRLDATALAGRETSRQSRDAVLMARLKRELRSEAAGGSADAAFGWLFRWAPPALRGLRGVPRVIAAGITILVVLVLARTAIAVVPPYIGRFMLKDRMAEVARAPLREDRDVLTLLMHAVEAQGLGERIHPESFEIATRPLWRVITCRYEVPLQLFPGFPKSLRFEIRVEQPYFVKEPEP